MMRTTAVFELNPVTDDPRFEGFALVATQSLLGRNSLDDDLTPGFADAEQNQDWCQPSLSERWPSPRAEGRVSEFNDYPCLDLTLPAFSNRAVNVLRDLLEPNGEILPLSTNTESKYFFFNILTISDALDQISSSCEFWSDPPTTATDISFFVFDVNKIQGLSIFRIRQFPMSVFVTNVFVDRVESYKLQGFNFKKVWPIARGVDWRKQTTPDDEPRRRLKRHTLVFLLPLNGANEEISHIREFEKALDAHLSIKSLNSDYVGSYEGYDVLKDEYRMFVSCPDADRMYDFIRPVLSNLQWPRPIKVCLRYGRLYDSTSKEEIRVV